MHVLRFGAAPQNYNNTHTLTQNDFFSCYLRCTLTQSLARASGDSAWSMDPSLQPFACLPPISFRWIVLLLIPWAPIGGHFFKNSLSSMEVFLLQDEDLHITYTMYGTLVASFSIANVFMPIIGGHYIDNCGHRSGLLTFLGICLCGVLVCIYAIYIHSFWLCVLGAVLYGAAHGNVVVAMRAVLSKVR